MGGGLNLLTYMGGGKNKRETLTTEKYEII